MRLPTSCLFGCSRWSRSWALCGPVDLVLFKALEESEKRELSRERVRLLEEQLQAQEQYLRRLSADIDEARRVREDVARELAAVDDLLQRQEAEQASRGLMKRSASWIRPASARASTRWSMPSSR